MTSFPGAASGVGSWPGTDVGEAVRTTFGLLGGTPHLPYLPELPARGPGSEMIGRGAALLVEMPVDLQPSGWRLVDHPGRDLKRALSWLGEDLDVLAEVAEVYSGPVKLQVTGPWTLAASLHLARLERAVADPGAVRDLVASLAEGTRRHVAKVADLVPGAQIVLQVDEPSLGAVLAGDIPTASGFGRLRAVDEAVVVAGLHDVLDAAAQAGAVQTVLHSCAPAPPMRILARAVRTGALGVDLAQLDVAAWEVVGEMLDGGASLFAGVVPTDAAPDGRAEAVRDAAAVLLTPWRRLGIDTRSLERVVLTPACGLAAAAPAAARSILERLKEAGGIVADAAQA